MSEKNKHIAGHPSALRKNKYTWIREEKWAELLFAKEVL